MARMQISAKRVAIDKANTQVLIIAGIAAFLIVFSLVATNALISQIAFLSKVISKQEDGKEQLDKNIKAASNLETSYKAFVKANPNALGGDSQGTGEKDGDNATLVLDALPSSYDFPALTSSIEKLLSQKNLKASGITGTDEELTQGQVASSENPAPVNMNFNLSVNDASYSSVKGLLETLQASIRPIQVDKMTLTGGSEKMQLSVDAHTYFQPGKTLSITKDTIK